MGQLSSCRKSPQGSWRGMTPHIMTHCTRPQVLTQTVKGSTPQHTTTTHAPRPHKLPSQTARHKPAVTNCRYNPQILNLLLGAIHMRARLSLPATLSLVSALGRDLQADFLAPSLLPKLLATLSSLLNDQDGDRDTEVIEQVFTCVSMLFKHLARHMLEDLPAVLRASRGLRYARAPHVRAFAAQATGFLVRTAAAAGQLPSSTGSTAPGSTVPGSTAQGSTDTGAGAAEEQGDVVMGEEQQGAAGMGAAGPLLAAVRTLLHDQARTPSEEVTDGVGLTLGEAVLGVGNGLHSRAPVLLALLLSQDVLTPADFKQAAPTQEALRARATAVACVALDRILSHLRRGKAGELWAALLKEANTRLDVLDQALAAAPSDAAAAAPGGTSVAGQKSGKRVKLAAAAGQTGSSASMGTESVAAAAAAAARAIALVAQAVHYYRGSRVEDYGKLQPLIGRLMRVTDAWAVTAPAVTVTAVSQPPTQEEAEQPTTSAPPAPGTRKRGRAAAATDATAATAQEEEEQAEPFLRPSLSGQTLRLALGVVHGHIKVVGASQGPQGLARLAAGWGVIFTRAPPQELLPFIAGGLVPCGFLQLMFRILA